MLPLAPRVWCTLSVCLCRCVELAVAAPAIAGRPVREASTSARRLHAVSTFGGVSLPPFEAVTPCVSLRRFFQGLQSRKIGEPTGGADRFVMWASWRRFLAPLPRCGGCRCLTLSRIPCEGLSFR